MRSAEQPPRVVYGITLSWSAATLLHGQLGWFSSHGWDVHLVTSRDETLATVVERERVTPHVVPMEREIRLLRDVRALAEWIRLLRRLRPDVVNAGTPKASLLGIVASWLTRVPTRVYVMRGLRVEGARTWRERALLWSAERLTVGLATDVVCVSESLRHEAAARHLLGRRGAAVVLGKGSSNGVDPDRWDPALAAVDRDAVRREWDVCPDEVVIGYVGRITPDKGVDDLLAASARLSDLPLRLVLVGSMDDEGLRRRIAALGRRAIHIDLVEDLSPVYAAIDVLCLPTRREGFPNVVLEAALAGVPTVTTTATGARDSVVPGVTGWSVPTGDVDQLTDTLRSCAADRRRLREVGRAARAHALDNFRPEDIWSGLESIYLSRLRVPSRADEVDAERGTAFRSSQHAGRRSCSARRSAPALTGGPDPRRRRNAPQAPPTTTWGERRNPAGTPPISCCARAARAEGTRRTPTRGPG